MDNNINGMSPEGFDGNNNAVINNEDADLLSVNSNNSNNSDNMNEFVGSDEFNNLEKFTDKNNADKSGKSNNTGSNSGIPKSNVKSGDGAKKNKFKINDFSVSGIWNAVKDWWKNLAGKTKVRGGVAAACVILFLIILTAILNASSYAMTYTNLDSQEAGEIINILNSYKIKYKWDNALRTISLKENDQAKAIAALAAEGYPKKGEIVYDTVPSGGMFETESDKKARLQQDLENRLGATINTITGVDYAAVNLTIPDNSMNTLLSQQQPSTAAVLLHLKPGYTLSTDTVKGIELIIEKSVEGLTEDNISITDGDGKILNDFSNSTDSSMLTVADIKKNYELEKESYINQKVMDILAGPFGADGVRVASTVTADFDKFVQEAKNYTGTNVDENGVQSGILASQATDRTVTSNSDPNAAGAAGTATNTDANGYYEAPVDTTTGDYSDDNHLTEEYLANYVLTQMERTSPDITNMSLTVVVDSNNEPDGFVEDDLIMALATATGINNIAMKNMQPGDVLNADYYRQYISVVEMPFQGTAPADETTATVPEFFGLSPFQLLLAAGAGVILLIILVIIVIILAKNSRRRRIQSEMEEENALLAADGVMGSDANSLGMALAKHAAYSSDKDRDEDEITPIEAKEQMLKRQIKMFTDQNPEIAAQLIRTLIKEDQPNG
ncbi:MAG: flagellar M-ring protein FliF [Oscillospiraceae bacterium]|nr:flagellar M-ring protein FliF [Oscillospiraceae bacterium]